MRRLLVRRLNLIAATLLFLSSVVVPAAGAEKPPATPTAGTEQPEIPNTLKGRQCVQQCGVFRAQCLPYCRQMGHVPGSQTRSADCGKACKEFQSGCLRVCLGLPPQQVPAKTARPSEAPAAATGGK